MAPPEDTADNRLVISGVLVRDPERRVSPAGVPICSFTLEHLSRRLEAGMAREVRCRIGVTASGAELQRQTAGLRGGGMVRVKGFLNRSAYRQPDAHLVLHAESIDRLDTALQAQGPAKED